ncbi:unnamed protein product [Protopolystoma xenopodis]|uniref:Uncharacterized protein n=1 Tax=Protopolystoma xenopodis TaxID=117903 RepID=A0A448XEK3_9PLAT|nr:unnamed protein product [Protopolystoma xenopodis]
MSTWSCVESRESLVSFLLSRRTATSVDVWLLSCCVTATKPAQMHRYCAEESIRPGQNGGYGCGCGCGWMGKIDIGNPLVLVVVFLSVYPVGLVCLVCICLFFCSLCCVCWCACHVYVVLSALLALLVSSVLSALGCDVYDVCGVCGVCGVCWLICYPTFSQAARRAKSGNEWNCPVVYPTSDSKLP